MDRVPVILARSARRHESLRRLAHFYRNFKFRQQLVSGILTIIIRVIKYPYNTINQQSIRDESLLAANF